MIVTLAIIGLAVTVWCVARARLELQRSHSSRFCK